MPKRTRKQVRDRNKKRAQVPEAPRLQRTYGKHSAPVKNARRQRFASNEWRVSPSNQLAMSLTNPFDTTTCIPDGARGTGCFSVKGSAGLGTGAAGTACCFLLNLDPANQTFGQNSGTVGTWTLPGTSLWTQAPQLAAIQNIYSRFRPISAGVRVYYVGATQTDQGTIVASQISGSTFASNLNGTNTGNSTLSTDSMWLKWANLRNGIEICWRPEDQEDYTFSSTTNANTTLGSLTPTQTPFLFVGVDGCQSSSGILRIEYVVNYEGQYQNVNLTVGSQTLKAAQSGWFEKTMNMIRNVSPFATTLSAISAVASTAAFAGHARLLVEAASAA